MLTGASVCMLCVFVHVYSSVFLCVCATCVLQYMCVQCSAVVTYVVFDRHAGEGLLQQQGCGCGSGHLHLSQSGVGQSRLYSTVQPDAR